jgi:hypothetical protein
MCGRGYEYDIAVSFAGEDRAIVESFVCELKKAGVKVFYDAWEQASLWGKDLVQHLDKVYRQSARFCIVFVSRDYAKKAWTSHELRSAQARSFAENTEYILPVRLDDTELPGLPPTIGYLDLKNIDVPTLASLVLRKLQAQDVLETTTTTTTAPGPKPAATFRIPRVARTNFDPLHEAHNLISHVETVLDQRIHVLRDAGLAVNKINVDGGGRLYRVTSNKRLIYFFRMTVGSPMGDHILSFLDGWNEPASSNAATAYGEVQQAISQKDPVISLTNLGLLETPGVSLALTFDEFAERVWQKACNVIESIMNR